MKITEAIHHLLNEHGFDGDSGYFSRKRPFGTEAIQFQKHSSTESVTVNLGIFVERIYVTVWQEALPFKPVVSSATLHARLGLLISDYDKWYALPDESTSLEADLEGQIGNFFLCQDDCACLIERSADYRWMSFSPSDLIGRACLLWEAGNFEGAIGILSSLSLSRSKIWSERAETILTELKRVPLVSRAFPIRLSM